MAEVLFAKDSVELQTPSGTVQHSKRIFLVFKGKKTQKVAFFSEIFMLFEMSRSGGQRVTFVEFPGRTFRRLRLRQLRSTSMMACHRLVKTSESSTERLGGFGFQMHQGSY